MSWYGSVKMDQSKLECEPCSRTWERCNGFEKSFRERFSSIFSNMRACGVSGVTILNSVRFEMRYVYNQYCGLVPQEGCTRYGVANYLVSKHTTDSTGKKMNVCNKCRSGTDQEKENVYVVMQSPEYMLSILKLHPLKVQLLSFLDISMRLKENKLGFLSGQIEDISLLNNPLVSSSGCIDEEEFVEGLVNDLQPIIEGNCENPWFKKYVTNFESPNYSSTSICVLSQDVIQTILDTHDTGSKSCIEEEDSAKVEKLSLLLNVGSSNGGPVSKDFLWLAALQTKGKDVVHCYLSTRKVCKERLGT